MPSSVSMAASLAVLFLCFTWSVSATSNALASTDSPSGCYWYPSSYGECEVTTCGNGLKYRDVNCYCDGAIADASSCSEYAPSTETSCSVPCVDFEWSVTSWSGCNVSCGTGYNSREIECKTTAGVSAESTYCTDSTPVFQELCTPNSVSCTLPAVWNWGEWSDCSASCGTGHQSRDRWCVGVGFEIIDDVSCDCDSLPTFRECNIGACETWSWEVTSYSDCSVSCAWGYRERTVSCVSSVRGTVASSECVHAGLGSAPEQVTLCEATSYCPTYEWKALGFGDCSVSCGTGEQTQAIECIETHTSDAVDDSFCTGSTPVTTQSCTATLYPVCETWSWNTTTWGDCSVTCGTGEKTRDVSCVGTLGDVDATYLSCADTMPAQFESCSADQCPFCKWTPGAFGDCSATCGTDGVWTRSVTCYCNDVEADAASCVNDANPWDTSESCGVRDCPTYSWDQSGFGDCSTTCGTGYRYQTVSCVSSEGVTVDQSYCGTDVPDSQESCDTGVLCTKPGWAYGSWGVCSASCGYGTKARSVWCAYQGAVVDDSECTGDAPSTSDSCLTVACETFSWQTSSYGDCSATCQGIATRSVWCESSQRGLVHAYHCEDAGSKPDTSYVCASDLCPIYDWVPISWSDCSASCGAGTQTLSLKCENVVTSTDVDDSYCIDLVKPTTEQVCTADACEIYQWVPYGWSNCSVSCGDGVSTRDVLCVGVYYGEIDTTNTECSGTRPETSTDCSESACPTYSWQYGTYAPCASCSQIRDVWCQSSTGDVVDDSFCTDTQPSTSRSCISSDACENVVVERTYEWSTEDWSNCSVTCGSGTWSRSVLCYQNLTIIVDGVVTISTYGTVDQALCTTELATTPDSEEVCDTDVACEDVVGYQPGSWGDCSASCGWGHVTRVVYCLDSVSGTIVDNSLCTGTEPTSTDDCYLQDCESWQWVVGSWDACTVTCATGFEERAVTCVSSLHGPVDDTYCIDNVGTKPTDHEVCGPFTCVECFWNRGDWTDGCSASCGVGQNTRDVSCLCTDGSTDSTGASCSGSQPASTKTCELEACTEAYHWVPQSYNDDCSVSCGTGIRTREVLCVGDVTGTIDTTGLQCSGETEPDTTGSCTADIPVCETFSWKYTAWSDCSVTCGVGQETRTAVCVGSLNDVDVTGAGCVGLAVDVLYQDCFPAACPVCNWLVGTWSDCGVSCGNGERTREVACVNTLGVTCEAWQCDASAQPAATTTCELACCTTFSWYVGQWGSCSVSCGVGTKSREAYCHDQEGLIVDAEDCQHLGSTPAVDEVCTESDCTGPAWANGDWSSCTSSCGSGTRTRDVYCRDVDGSTLDDSACANAGDAPADAEDCNLCACEQFIWEVSTWADCSASCGVGFQQRTVTCRSTLRGYVSNDLCTESKPNDNRECTAVCWNWVPGDYGDCSVTIGYGLRTRNVYCVGSDGEVDATGSSCTGSAPVDTEVCCADSA